MKIRNGFVSNSSSSSYIIAFNRKIDIRKLFAYGSFTAHSNSALAVGANEFYEALKDYYYEINYEWDAHPGFYASKEEWEERHSKVWHEILFYMKSMSDQLTDDEDIAYIQIPDGDSKGERNLRIGGIRVLKSERR